MVAVTVTVTVTTATDHGVGVVNEDGGDASASGSILLVPVRLVEVVSRFDENSGDAEGDPDCALSSGTPVASAKVCETLGL